MWPIEKGAGEESFWSHAKSRATITTLGKLAATKHRLR
jgi:hypothetical protein